MDMKNFDPEMEAFKKRRAAKAMRLIVDISPDGDAQVKNADQEHELKEAIVEHEKDDELQDKSLIKEMLAEQEAKEDAEEKDEYAKDEEKAKADMMGGYSEEETMEEFKDKAPKTLGAKVRLAIAKKGMKA